MSLKSVSYTDSEGRKKAVLLPEYVSEEDAEMGIPLGPPSLESLNLPPDIEVRLHNELFNRGIIQQKDAIRNRQGIMQALMSAFKVDVDRILTVYIGEDYRNANYEPAEDFSNPPLPDRRPSESVKPPKLPTGRPSSGSELATG